MKNILLWDNLTSLQIEAAARRDPVVLIPVGSVEQHGPHLPVGCDHILASAMASRIAAEMAGRGVEAIIAARDNGGQLGSPYELCGNNYA